MKNRIQLILLFLAFIAIYAFNSIDTQCPIETHKKQADKMVEPPYRYLTSFEIHNEEGSKEQVSFDFELGKDMDHQITMSGDQKMKLEIFDSNKKQLLSNDINGELFTSVVFNPPSKEKYTFVFSFLDDKPICGAASIGFNLER